MDPKVKPETESAPTATTAAGDAPTNHAVEVSALKAWLTNNLVSLIVTAVVVALICIYLDPIDTLKVVIGLGLVIFIHELGHFLAAKWCDVHVKTFSIGFGPSVPFCSYKWGETTYMLGIIPLGGYVSMVGEGDGAGDEDAEEDPRSFRHKPVGQRMMIISAGVIMNVLLGMGCFVAAYLHGVKEEPAVVGGVVSGGAAWQAGLHADDRILSIDGRNNPSFKELRPIVMSTRKGQKVELLIKRDDQKPFSVTVEPLREEGTYFPTLGINAQSRLTLLAFKKKEFQPTVPGSVAARASPPFEPGDRIIGMTDPKKPDTVSLLGPDPYEPDGGANIDEYYDRMEKLAGKPIVFQVLRRNEKKDITVQPAFRYDLGLRMQMGEVCALRQKGPAEQAGVIARTEGPPAGAGDRIKTVKLVSPDGAETWYTTGDVKNEQPKDSPKVSVQKLDPLLLPLEIKKWAEQNSANRTVKLVVLRTVDHKENTPVDLSLAYDPTFGDDREFLAIPNSPTPLPGLGLAYWVEGVVDEVTPDGPAASAESTSGGAKGLRPKDVITAVRFKKLEYNDELNVGKWEDIKSHQWAWADAMFQSRPPYDIDLRIKRGEETIEYTLKGRQDANWPVDDRGLIFQLDFQTHQAADIGDALNLGARRTVRFIKDIYMNLYSIVIGRVSPKTMSGPLTIASASYRLAGEDFWQFLLFLGMISVNLAVVNFLPIPVLDGGHMVFLILEKILGRPVPERVFAFAMYTGFFLILSLMAYVIYLDVKREF